MLPLGSAEKDVHWGRFRCQVMKMGDSPAAVLLGDHCQVTRGCFCRGSRLGKMGHLGLFWKSGPHIRLDPGARLGGSEVRRCADSAGLLPKS